MAIKYLTDIDVIGTIDSSENITAPSFQGDWLTYDNSDAINWNSAYLWGDHSLEGYENTDNKNQNGGYAGLDGAGKIPTSLLPDLAITETFVVNSGANMLALSAQTGDVAVRTDVNETYILAGSDPTVLADWQKMLTPTDAVNTVNGLAGNVQLDLSFSNGDLSLTGSSTIIDLDARYQLNTYTEVSNLDDVLQRGNTSTLDATVGQLTATDGLDVSASGTEPLSLSRSGSADLILSASGSGNIDISHSGSGSILQDATTFRGDVGVDTNLDVTGTATINNGTVSTVPNGSGVSLELGREDLSSFWRFNHAGSDLRIYNTDGSNSDVIIGLDAGGSFHNNRLGIGTTPTEALDVNGNIKASGTGVFGSFLYAGNKVLVNNSTSNVAFTLDTDSNTSGLNSKHLEIWGSSSVSDISFSPSTTSKNLLHLDGSENTATFGGKIHIDKGGSLPNATNSNSSNWIENNAFRIEGGNNGFSIGVSSTTNSRTAWLQSGHAATEFASSVNDSELLLQPLGGNVGIGTDNIGATLDIVGSTIGLRVKNSSLADVFRVYSQGSGVFVNNGNFHVEDYVKLGSNSTPTEVLDVEGNIKVSGKGAFGEDISSDAQLIVANKTADIQMRIGSISSSDSNGINPYVRFQGRKSDGSAVNYADIKLDVDAEKLIFNDPGINSGSIGQYPMSLDSGGNLEVNGTATFGGNVGIGTDSPTSPLTIKSNSTSSSSSGLTIQSNGNTNNIFELAEKSTDGARLQMYDAGVAKIALYTDGTDNYINAGKVGVGTTSPAYKLDISGDIRATSEVFWGNNNNSPVGRLYAGAQTGVMLNTENDGAIVLAGGNTTAAGGNIAFFGGTHASQANAVRFRSGSTETMRIDSSGNVGIGTTSPSRKLQVKGTANTAIAITSSTANLAQLALGDTDDDNYAQILLDNSTNKLQIQNGGGGVVSNRGITLDSSENVGIGTDSPSSKLHIKQSADTIDGGLTWESVDGTQEWSIDANNAGNFRIYKGTTAIARFDSSGNFGIGTTSPGAKLDVIGVGLSSLFRVSNTEADATTKYGAILGRHYTNAEENVTGMLITSSSNSLTGQIVSIGGGISSANAVNEIKFYTAANNTTLTGSERMRITSTGNVGIGTTSPDSKLEVTGDTASALLTLKSENGGSNDAFMRFYNEASSDSYSVGLDSGDSKFKIAYGADGDSLTTGTKLVMDTSGNIGIGTTSPTDKLHVVGNIAVTGIGNFSSDVNAAEFKLEPDNKVLFDWGEDEFSYIKADASTLNMEYYSTQDHYFKSGDDLSYANIYANNFILGSDARIKENVNNLDTKPINADWKSFNIINKKEDYRVGVIAQELEENHPEFVNTDESGFKTVKYIDLLIAKIAELEARLEKLEN